MDQEFLNQLHEANRIETVVADYVSLKKAGRNYVCNCPFHSEKSPSCTIFVDNQNFYCFGCGVGGDVITFVKKIEDLTFGETIEKLAARAGMKVPKDENTKKITHLKERILDINRETANFYYKNLLRGNDKRGLMYFSERKMLPQTIKKYGLGFAPDAYDVLYKHLKHLGFSDDEMIAAEVCRMGKYGMYDLFRNRVMFPIISLKGSVIGFGGRVLDDSKPKYLNSPQTLVFDKGKNCFSFNFAKDSSSNTMILAEGYMDVISMNQAGFDNVIATLGTSITADQARLISKYAERVVISYDSDGAGQKAARRAINILSEAGLKTSVLKIQGAKDPDEYIKKYGAERFRRIVNGAGDALEFQIEQCRQGLDLESESDKAKFIKKAAEILADISGDIMREVYISKFCNEYSFDKGVMLNHIESLRRKQIREKKNETWKKISGQTYKSSYERNQDTRTVKAEKKVISSILLGNPVSKTIFESLTEKDFSDELMRKTYGYLFERQTENISFQMLSESFSDDDMGKISGMIASFGKPPISSADVGEYIDIIKKSKKTEDENITDQDLLDLVNMKKL